MTELLPPPPSQPPLLFQACQLATATSPKRADSIWYPFPDKVAPPPRVHSPPSSTIPTPPCRPLGHWPAQTRAGGGVCLCAWIFRSAIGTVFHRHTIITWTRSPWSQNINSIYKLQFVSIYMYNSINVQSIFCKYGYDIYFMGIPLELPISFCLLINKPTRASE